MADKKTKANKFTTDIDLCQNQIKNYSSEYWGDRTEHDHLPDEAHGDVVFEGKHIYLMRDFEVTLEDGTKYVYQAGSECICHKDATTQKFYWQKQLSSAISEDLSGSIYELWREKSGKIRNYATKAALDAVIGMAGGQEWQNDLGIVENDETHDGNRTLYVANGDGNVKTSAVTSWTYITTLENHNRTNRTTNIGTGISTLSNEGGDKGACMTFVKTGGNIKSGIAVHDGSAMPSGNDFYAEMYVVDSGNDGTRILAKQNKIYYLGPGETVPQDKDELATMEYVVMSASKCLGWVDDYAHLPTTGMNAADYVYVRNDEHELASRTGETIAPSTRYYRNADNTAWIYSCDVGNNGIRLLGVEEHSKQPYHIPFNINELVQEPTKIKTTFDTITLDNKATKVTYPIEIPSADVTHDKAGLYTKTLADKKLNIYGEMAPGQPCRVPYFFEVSYGADKATVKDYTVTLDNNQTKETFDLDINSMNYADNKAGLYTKAMADAKLNIYGEMAPGQPCRVPYFFEVSYEADKAKVTDYTVRLDNSQQKESFNLFINSMNYADNKAGLYTKAMADAKLDILTGAPDGKAYKLPYYFETVPDASKITVKAHTITLDNKKEVDTTSYFIDVVGATADKAGLMTAADKIKLDGLVVDTYSTPEATDKAMSVRLAMEKIKELGHDFVGDVATHDRLVDLIYKPGSTTKRIDINDIAVVLDDSGYPGTPSHNKECWRYRCIDASKLGTLDAWAPEYRISNIPFTTKQWNMINAYEIEETNGFSYISNLKGDGGACLKFISNDLVDSAVAVNNGGLNGIAAQIYAIQHGDPTQGVKLNVRKSGLYYLKNKATPATEDPDDELTVRGDFKSISFTLSESGWATPATGSTFWLQEVTVAGIKATDNPIVSADYSDGSTVDEIRELQEEAGKILKAETLDGGIRFFAEDDLGKDIKILVRVI